ncbi:MAG: abortive infection family protein [Chloroflexi bacterium]|nr:abortive infection family protein [Chloroflexota bacterium]
MADLLQFKDIEFVVAHYIGEEGFSYQRAFGDEHSLRQFYLVDCELDIQPSSPDTRNTLERFVEVLVSQPPQNQAKILRAVRGSIPPGDSYTSRERRAKMQTIITGIIERLDSESTFVDSILPKSTSEVVREALADAEHSISRGRPASAVAATHTALHGYFKQMCDDESIVYKKDMSLPKLFKLLQENHSAFQRSGQHQDKIDNVGKGLATAIHSLNEIRNNATPAHPNDELLDVCDAMLAINALRSIFHYVEEKRSLGGRNLFQRIMSPQ